MSTAGRRSPWAWVPTLYLAQGAPYVLVMSVSTLMFKRMGVDNTQIAFWTSWIGLTWSFKALWSPLVEVAGTRRGWVLATQAATSALLALVAFALPLPFFFQATIALFVLIALSSATHDIAADGLYLLGLSQAQQSAWVGIRSTFWRLAMILCEGPLVVLAGRLEATSDPATAWGRTFLVAAGLFFGVFLLHLVALPRPEQDVARPLDAGSAGRGLEVFRAFFRKPDIVRAVLFLVFFRFAENQLGKLVGPFLLDPVAVGGLGLTTEQVGVAKGTFGVAALLLGGVLGGLAISRHGLRAWMWPMALILNLPDALFLWMAWAQPTDLTFITAALAAEQFGYGFGLTAYLMFLISLAEGEHQTAHYAIGTGIMALAVSLSGMYAGALQEALGYPGFFAWVMVSTIPALIVPALVRIDPDFGRKRD